MTSRIKTVAFEGMRARTVEVQAQATTGLASFQVVGLGDKAVAESRERVRAALSACGLGLPPKRIVVNLAPADLPKEGSHYDLPIALALLGELGALEPLALEGWTAMGELGLDGGISRAYGVLPGAMRAMEDGTSFMCPSLCGAEAAWSGLGEEGSGELAAPETLLEAVNHLLGRRRLGTPRRGELSEGGVGGDLSEVRGQETAKRALELSAAGGHNLLMTGPPGAGKSMLAARLPGILPQMDAREMLEASMIASLAGELRGGVMTRRRPFRAPHHSASMAAMSGGGRDARPGEASLAHEGVLFLDEAAEFSASALDSLRQAMESGEVLVARARAHVKYPARIQVVAAMNPCRCGYAGDPQRACGRLPRCMRDYAARLSGPFMDRMDVRVDVEPVRLADLSGEGLEESSASVALRVAAARGIQERRWGAAGVSTWLRVNARAPSAMLVEGAEAGALELLEKAGEVFGLSARGYHRALRVARTAADLEAAAQGVEETPTLRRHVAEALSYRAGAATWDNEADGADEDAWSGAGRGTGRGEAAGEAERWRDAARGVS